MPAEVLNLQKYQITRPNRLGQLGKVHFDSALANSGSSPTAMAVEIALRAQTSHRRPTLLRHSFLTKPGLVRESADRTREVNSSLPRMDEDEIRALADRAFQDAQRFAHMDRGTLKGLVDTHRSEIREGRELDESGVRRQVSLAVRRATDKRLGHQPSTLEQRVNLVRIKRRVERVEQTKGEGEKPGATVVYLAPRSVDALPLVQHEVAVESGPQAS